MYKTKKELDGHVQNFLGKVRPGTERNLRCLTAAKLYYKNNDYAKAIEHLYSYMNTKKDDFDAYKLLGNCYKCLNKSEEALQAFRQSLTLNRKQSDLIIEVCRMLLNNNILNKAQYWLDTAEAENISNDVIFELRLKLLNKAATTTNSDADQWEEIILKEITAHPNNVTLRVRLLRSYVDYKKFNEAIKYAYDTEMQWNDNHYTASVEWYNTIWYVLNTCETIKDVKKDWKYWLLILMCLERQINIELYNNNENINTCQEILHTFDQYLLKVMQLDEKFHDVQHELVQVCLLHYQAQLLLHLVEFSFKREIFNNKNKWKETLHNVLPLMLLGYQLSTANSSENWLKHCNEDDNKLMKMWSLEAAFRRAQLGRTLISCVSDKYTANADELISLTREICSRKDWRNDIYMEIFKSSEQKLKESSSCLIKSTKIQQPIYIWPKQADVEDYEYRAQSLRPQSLAHYVYLCLGNENLADITANYYANMNFSVQNLSYCSVETLSQLDMDSFLYATAIQAKRQLEIDRQSYDNYNAGDRNAMAKPRLMPFANIGKMLCSKEQENWWHAAFRVYTNQLNQSNLSELRTVLQHGLEAVRGVNGPKLDLYIIFKLGHLMVTRSQGLLKASEKHSIEARAEQLFKQGLNMYKRYQKGFLETYNKYFVYAKSNIICVEKMIKTAAEDAVSYLSARYFKRSEYDEFISEMNGLELPTATYMQAEAYRRLDECNETPSKSKQNYYERRAEYLQQTQKLLKNDSEHPLSSLIAGELNRLHHYGERYQFAGANDSFGARNDLHNNSSNYEDAEENFYGDILNFNNRVRRETLMSAITQRNIEVEKLIKDMSLTLGILRDEVVDRIKPEVMTIRKEVNILKDRMTELDESLKKMQIGSQSRASVPDDEETSQMLDLYMLDEVLQNQMTVKPQQQQQHQQMLTPALAHAAANNYTTMFNGAAANAFMPTATPNQIAFQQAQSRLFTPNNMSPYNTMLTANPNTLNYYSPQAQFVMPTQQAAVSAANMMTARNSNYGGVNMFGPQNPYMDPTNNLNFNLSTQLAAANQLMQQNLQPQQQQQQPQQQPQIQTASAILPNVPITLTSTSLINPVPSAISNNANILSVFNKALNNQPVEKGLPANVVITSSDPLPKPTSVAINTQQPTLSVTIPPQHIKSSLVAVTSDTTVPGTTNLFATVSHTPIFTNSVNTTTATSTTNLFKGFSLTTSNTVSSTINTTTSQAFSLKTQIEQNIGEKTAASANSSASDESTVNPVNIEAIKNYEPIVPLPEVELYTGEENEMQIFCERARLFRLKNKGWKECGLGDIKIFKNIKEGFSRVIMRLEPTGSLCANHKILPELMINKLDKDNKCCIWTANEFFEGNVCKEQFMVHFKNNLIADAFIEEFKKAQIKMVTINDSKESLQYKEKEKEQQINPTKTFTFSQNIGALGFATSTPAHNRTETSVGSNVDAGGGGGSVNVGSSGGLLAKPVNTLPIAVTGGGQISLFTMAAAAPTQTNKPFANFSFRQGDNNSDVVSTPPKEGNFGIANIFNNKQLMGSNSSPLGNSTIYCTPLSTPKCGNAIKTDSTDIVEDEYVPTAQFKPVIPLPELVEVSTGEENEIILFEHRAKLLRYSKEDSDWKERGLGSIKLLQAKDNVNQVRLVMRREQVHKLCCNQRLLKETKFKHPKNSLTALTWAGQDYADAELSIELLCVRFKTPEICKNFHDAIVKAQALMTDTTEKEEDSKKQNEKQTADIISNSKNAQQGFSDVFKPKVGSWTCDACYVSNEAESNYCVACDTPKDNTVPKKESVSTNAINLTPIANKCSFDFGNNVNNANVSSVAAANKTVINKSSSSSSSSNTTTTTSNVVGFGERFKPKAGSWICKDCYVNNVAESNYCSACEAPKDENVAKKETDVFGGAAVVANKFNFGFAATATTGITTENKSAIPMGGGVGSGSGTFVFGAKTETKETPFMSLKSDSAQATFTFTPPTATSTKLGTDSNEAAITTTSSQNSTTNFTFTLANNKAMESANAATPTFSLDKKDFNFTMKPKSPGRSGKTVGDGASAVAADAENDDDDSYAEEENNAYFTPVISLPDKIEVKTGEEDEEVLYVHRAKLFRLVDDEWKERGLGDVKILRHKETKKLRVVMRREKILKICLNHPLTADINYKPMDDKSWLFAVYDFSEGENVLERFSLRFKTADIAKGFLNAVETALTGKAEPIEEPKQQTSALVDIKLPKVLSEETKKLAKKLMLPYEFFTTENVCSGCRGCEPDQFVYQPIPYNEILSVDNAAGFDLPLYLPALIMPIKPLPSKLGSFSDRYNVDNTSEVPSVGSFSITPNLTLNNKEKSTNKSGSSFLFGNSMTAVPIFGQAPAIFGNQSNGNSQINNKFFGETPSIFASHGSVSDGNATKSIFASKSEPNETKSSTLFTNIKATNPGNVDSIFSSNNNNKTMDIFGGKDGVDNTGNVCNFFSSMNANKPTFGEVPIFGAGNKFGDKLNITTKEFIEKGKNGNVIKLFGSRVNKAKITFTDANATTAKTENYNATNVSSTITNFGDLAAKAAASDDFASLAAKASNVAFQKPSNRGDTYIGLTHQNAFSSFSKQNNSSMDGKENKKDSSLVSKSLGTAEEDENYDPHYEPVIPLPQEVVVTTGEEDETKLFGERSTLYRYDVDLKEWKERGVGELKILKHPVNRTYRLVMRREQIHKVVLNHSINTDFSFNTKNNNPKTFVWGCVNYAETPEGNIERLAVRFKKQEIADAFRQTLDKCIDDVKQQNAAN